MLLNGCHLSGTSLLLRLVADLSQNRRNTQLLHHYCVCVANKLSALYSIRFRIPKRNDFACYAFSSDHLYFVFYIVVPFKVVG